MVTRVLAAVEYVLGEEALDYREAEGFGASDLPRKPDLWGWGRFHRASSPVLDLQIGAAARTLRSADVDPRQVDAVMFCSANPPAADGPAAAPERRFLEALGLAGAFPLTMTSGGCCAMLAGVSLAGSMLSDGQGRHILVVAGDRVPAGGTRFQRYGIFSDAACCCIVSSELAEGFDIVRSSFAADCKSMQGDAPFSSELAARANDRLFAGLDVTAGDVTRVFGNNVFLPITLLKEQEAGFRTAQIYVDNVKRIGHCYAADALINLADYRGSTPIMPGEYFVAAADAPGLRCALLLRAPERVRRRPERSGPRLS